MHMYRRLAYARLLVYLSLLLFCGRLIECLPENSVIDKGLVSQNITYSDIIANHDKYDVGHSSMKRTKVGATLAYVTPWNSHGYDVVKLFRGKFDYVSPVWYNVKRTGAKAFVLEGAHDVDQPWMEKVRAVVDGKRVGKIVPRFKLSGWSGSAYDALLTDFEELDAFVKVLADECRKQQFDGLVLEASRTQDFDPVIQQLSKTLHMQSQELILVIPSKRKKFPTLTAALINDFARAVDLFSLMTYDYSDNEQAPNSPLWWLKENVLVHTPTARNRDKLLVGTNMYGYDFITKGRKHKEPVIGKKILELLEQHKPKVKWDEFSKEHKFDYEVGSIPHTVWYPTYYSIQERLELAEEFGTGLSIWEAGQGFDSFYDLI